MNLQMIGTNVSLQFRNWPKLSFRAKRPPWRNTCYNEPASLMGPGLGQGEILWYWKHV